MIGSFKRDVPSTCSKQMNRTTKETILRVRTLYAASTTPSLSRLRTAGESSCRHKRRSLPPSHRSAASHIPVAYRPDERRCSSTGRASCTDDVRDLRAQEAAPVVKPRGDATRPTTTPHLYITAADTLAFLVAGRLKCITRRAPLIASATSLAKTLGGADHQSACSGSNADAD
jgi:hypothetical protein